MQNAPYYFPTALSNNLSKYYIFIIVLGGRFYDKLLYLAYKTNMILDGGFH